MNKKYDLALGQLAFSAHPFGELTGSGSMRYLPRNGKEELIRLIAKSENCKEERITITTGASMALCAIVSCLPQKSTVLCPRPFYPPYLSLLKMFGHEIIHYHLTPENNFCPEEEEIHELVRNNKPQAVLWNFPHNPTGTVVSDTLRKKIFSLFFNAGILTISDEVYGAFCYEKKEEANISGEQHELLLRVKSFSKTMGLAGERLGYIIGSPGKIAEIAGKHWVMAMSAPAYAQQTAIRILSDNYSVQLNTLKKKLTQNRQIVLRKLATCKNLEFIVPRGGFFFWIKRKIFAPGMLRFSDMLMVAGINVVGGTAFGSNIDEDWFRLSFATDSEILIEALNLIELLQKH